MAGKGKELKRKLPPEARVSPPPLRRKAQSTLTQSDVSSFFTPLSERPPGKILWQERAPNNGAPRTLLVGKYDPEGTQSQKMHGQAAISKYKIAAFDFDSTLIQTSSGKKFGSDAHDWEWWHPSIPVVLRRLHMEDGYQISILSNQAGITLKNDSKAPKLHRSRLDAFKGKAAAVFTQLDIPISIYAATEKDNYRKPRTGMWAELLSDYGLKAPGRVDLGESFFVGDAGGRLAGNGVGKDFSCSDRNFADNVGIKFHSPDEFFLGQPPRPFSRTFDPISYVENVANGNGSASPVFSRRNDQDIVILCGSPGAGKSTFYWKHLQPLRYMRVNQDVLKTREKCIKVADEYLSQGGSVVVDNTNADPEVRSKWIALARKLQVPIRCVVFLAEADICEHNDVVRALNHAMNPEGRTRLPGIAFTSFKSRYRRPELTEGFQDITEVKFQFQGTDEERSIWARYWT